MIALFAILRPLLPYLAGLLILGGIYGWGHHNGEVAVQHKFDAFVAANREAVGKIQTAWDQERAANELAALRAIEHRDVTFRPIRERAHALPSEIAHIVVPPVAVGVLLDAIAATNEVTQSTAVPDQAAPANTASADLAALTQWAVDVLAIHRECTDRVHAWESFYAGLQKEQ